MIGRVLGAALAAAVGFGICAEAQTLADVGGPVNPPPQGFKGQQFIDARGCVFVRAGFDGRINWVPRIDAAKRPICGMEPTGAAPRATEAQPAQGGFLATLFAPQPAPVVPAPSHDLVLTVTPVEPRVLPKPPKGWKYAWKDDRLNPMRGIGTPAGEAEQDRAFTREVPMVARADLPAQPQAAKPQPTVTVSTMSATSAGILVQVGAFGDAGNAQRSGARIAALGLPMATSAQRGLTVVMAGPFASAAEAEAGLRALRGAGFADAFLR